MSGNKDNWRHGMKSDVLGIAAKMAADGNPLESLRNVGTKKARNAGTWPVIDPQNGGASFSDFYHDPSKNKHNTFMNGLAVQIGGNNDSFSWLEFTLVSSIILYAIVLIVLIFVRMWSGIEFSWCYDLLLSISAFLLLLIYVPVIWNLVN